MKNDCFAYKRIIGERQYKNPEELLCGAIRTKEAEKYIKKGKCGNLGCPFYKPLGKEHMIRTKDDLLEPIGRRGNKC